MTIPACTSAPINWIRCRDVRSSHLLLRKTKGRRGAVDTSVSGRDIKQVSPRSSSIHSPAAPGVETPQRAPTSTFSTFIFDTTGRMQVPNRQIGSYGYSVRNYAPAPLFPVHQVSQCAAPSKPSSGKSFTIEALLAKPEDTSPAQCGDKYHAAAPLLPLGGHAGLPLAAAAPCVCAPGVLPAALHTQPGYSVYCCPPFSYQQSCRAAFYAQGTAPVLPTLLNVRVASSLHVSETKCFSFLFFSAASMSKVNAGLHSFKTKGGKSKRMRTSFTSEQLSRLEKEFARQQYMVGSERFLLASALQLTEAQVRRPTEMIFKKKPLKQN